MQVLYDVPALGAGRDALRQMELMHRRREERALLAADSEAAALVRERKTERQRGERKQQAEIRGVLNDIISRLERRADRQVSRHRLTLLLPSSRAAAANRPSDRRFAVMYSCTTVAGGIEAGSG